MNVRKYKPIGLEKDRHRYVRNPTKQKRSNTRLELIATGHRLPRIPSTKFSLNRSFSTSNMQTNDGQCLNKNKLPDIFQSENYVSRCVSVPNISSDLEKHEKHLYIRTTSWETFEAPMDYATDMRKTEGYHINDFEKEDLEITDIMLGKDGYPSLGQREKEQELCEIVPHQVWKRNTIIGAD